MPDHFKPLCSDKRSRMLSLNECLARVREWVMDNEELMDEFEILQWDDEKPLDELRLGLLFDAFLFDYKLLESNSTPFEHFIEQAQFNQEERTIYEGLLKNFHGFFEVVEVKHDEGLRLRDLLDQREYWVEEKRGTHGTKVGEVVWCRIAPHADHFVIVGLGALRWGPEIKYVIGQYVIRGAEKAHRPSAFDVLKMTAGEPKKERSLKEIRKALKRKLRGLGIDFDFRTLPERINRAKSLPEAFPEILGFHFPSNREFVETMELLTDLWNKFSRKELGGLAPCQVDRMGPMEKTIYQVLLEEIGKDIDPEDYPSAEDAQKAADDFCASWLRTPQEELGGKTPLDVIFEEREALKNPSREITVRLQFSRLPDYDLSRAERLYQQGLEAFRRGDWVEAAELFEEVTEICPENYKAWGNLGVSFINLGLKNLAMESLEKALSIKPDYEIAGENLAKIRDMKEEGVMRLALLRALERALKEQSEKRGRKRF